MRIKLLLSVLFGICLDSAPVLAFDCLIDFRELSKLGEKLGDFRAQVAAGDLQIMRIPREIAGTSDVKAAMETAYNFVDEHSKQSEGRKNKELELVKQYLSIVDTCSSRSR
ncbi:hypothetical protein [Methylorubrum populi]